MNQEKNLRWNGSLFNVIQETIITIGRTLQGTITFSPLQFYSDKMPNVKNTKNKMPKQTQQNIHVKKSNNIRP